MLVRVIAGAAVALSVALVAAFAFDRPGAAGDEHEVVVYVGNGWFCPTPESCDQPYEVHAPNGATIRWVWAQGSHTSTACLDETYAEGDPANCGEQHGWDSGPLTEPEEFVHTLGSEHDDSTVHYYCELHPVSHRGVIKTGEAIPSPTPTPTPEPVLGDANGDGEVSMVDALVIARVVVGLDEPDSIDMEMADVNQDGDVNMVDALLIAQCVAHLVGGLPPDGPYLTWCADSPPEQGYYLVQDVPGAVFENMLGLYPIPGAPDEAVVLTQTGHMWRVSLSGAFEPELWADISDRVFAVLVSEEGLLGLAFSPDFENDSRVYVHYSRYRTSDDFVAGVVISRFLVVDGVLDVDSEEVLIDLDDREWWHNGGQLAFGPDGYLYIGIGDEGWAGDPHGNGQDVNTMFGTVLRLDVSTPTGYAIPPDNPLVGEQGLDEIYAWGFRNPWRFSFDRMTGQLWLGDAGQWDWEEVNIVEMGGNYGWNEMEGFNCFTPGCDPEQFELPRAVYPIRHLPECAIIGGFVYRGTDIVDLYGHYIFGDYCTGKIWALDAGDDTAEPELLLESGHPITSFAELPDGELLVITFSNAIFRIAWQG